MRKFEIQGKTIWVEDESWITPQKRKIWLGVRRAKLVREVGRDYIYYWRKSWEKSTGTLGVLLPEDVANEIRSILGRPKSEEAE